ncbi:hypothetical protein K461DRAFT_157881 [Myriangium duriaei CBS 260.36]|uniref:Uncharacterized protein n=1 Tax=Myriangium duriaei CBS 260.36 TaxID=1168546 RepID=A0A9P4IZL5_9PEZI|nr:hypothetical protein K461DRAFT_157881 [Myriangium duriaei CBS 260.36]
MPTKGTKAAKKGGNVPATPPITPVKSKATEDTDAAAGDEAAQEAPATPTPAKKQRNRAGAKKNAAPKEVYHTLHSSLGDAAPVTVSSQSLNVIAQMDATEFEMKLKLHAPQQFTYIDTVMLNDGQFAGHLAVLLQPAPAFPLLKLPPEIKRDIFRFVLAPEGRIGGKIVMTSDKNNIVIAKNYAEKGLKSRLGIMRVNKEVSEHLIAR